MQDIKKSNTAGVAKLSGRFLKDGAGIQAKPVSALRNLSISQRAFTNACKVQKIKAIFKKQRN